MQNCMFFVCLLINWHNMQVPISLIQNSIYQTHLNGLAKSVSMRLVNSSSNSDFTPSHTSVSSLIPTILYQTLMYTKQSGGYEWCVFRVSGVCSE